ncbi:MAG: TonB-dependent receptor [Cyclobacteriaceae bacterium]|nr:TonB-dependent receptor [Cyclobacteriaceae bacterium]
MANSHALWLAWVGLLSGTTGNAQSIQPDTARVLETVTVRAFDSNRDLLDIPASVAVVSPAQLGRFANVSLLPAVNMIPGVRMEERSPGSFRLAIRGSSLRSPFGVRNVKVYWNELPMTDAGGNTYLNQVDFNSVGQMEVVKGPGSSLYGAGTGGVLLINSPSVGVRPLSVQAGFIAGSFGMTGYNGAFNSARGGNRMSLQFGHLQAQGYRQHSAMTRDFFNWNHTVQLTDKESLSLTAFYSDLHYDTPGALTLAEYNNDPRQARPATSTLPSAEQQMAGVYQRTFYAGTSHYLAFNSRWSIRNGLYGNFVQFENPAIRNIEHRLEQTIGGRSNTQYNFGADRLKGQWNTGAEIQQGFSPIKTYANAGGIPGPLQSDAEIGILQYFLFSQVQLDVRHRISITAGASYNGLRYRFLDLANTASKRQESGYAPVLSPRLALLYRIHDSHSAHAGISNGFSPPTIAEIRPSTGVFTPGLLPEQGTNYELGLRGSFSQMKIQYDLVAYDFRLRQAIVVRRDLSGADYFVNAGGTIQRGAELWLAWTAAPATASCSLKIWSSLALQHYQFSEYVKGTADYSGNPVTGVPSSILSLGADLTTKAGLYARITMGRTSAITLNDAASESAAAYTLLGGRIGYQTTYAGTWLGEIFAGFDNLLDTRYSLGHDLNAAGNRYYNAAAGRSFFLGANLKFSGRKGE